jgi:excisionase family DNA binding protein
MPKIQSNNRLPSGEPHRFYSVAEFARDIGVHRRTVGKWIVDGKIHAIVVGETFAIPKSELLRIKREMTPEVA